MYLFSTLNDSNDNDHFNNIKSVFFLNLAKSGHFRLLYLKLIFHTIGQNFPETSYHYRQMKDLNFQNPFPEFISTTGCKTTDLQCQEHQMKIFHKASGENIPSAIS